MKSINDFFSLKNTVNVISTYEQEQTVHYLEPIKAFARTTYQSIYIIDYKEKGFEDVSENPLFLCGHTADEVKKMGYEFYLKYVTQADLDLLIKINTIGFEFYDRTPLDERKHLTISYDFHLRSQEGKIWKAMCIISIASGQKSGNIIINKKGSRIILNMTSKTIVGKLTRA